MLSDGQRSAAQLEAVLEVSLDLTKSLEPVERYERLLSAARRVIPFDSACIMALQGGALAPVATWGLDVSVAGMVFARIDHPRLDVILRSPRPVRFRPDAPIPDPFDGLIQDHCTDSSRIHSCVGCAVVDAGEVVGAFVIDAIDPGAFLGVDDVVISTFAALAGAAMRTDALFDALKKRADRGDAVMRELSRTVEESIGAVIIGTSVPIRRVIEEISLVASSNLPVLITGETGVGKELVAHRVHACSDRSDRPYIQVNCAALPSTIAESELFGHVRGAFTGAERDRPGKFEVADGGTLLLDEVGELPLELQGKLLRVLQNGGIQRVGSDSAIHVDVRVVAATNRDLETEVRTGRFRADLYHRLAAFPIHVPPLRERKDDIPLLASHFVARSRRRLGLGPVRISPAALERLAEEPWMGNVRELDNVVSRGVLRASHQTHHTELIQIETDHLDLRSSRKSEPGSPAVQALSTVPETVGFRERCELCKKEQITYTLKQNGGNWAATARSLGMHRSNLHRLASRLDILHDE